MRVRVNAILAAAALAALALVAGCRGQAYKTVEQVIHIHIPSNHVGVVVINVSSNAAVAGGMSLPVKFSYR